MISNKQRPLISGQTTEHAPSKKPTVTTWIYGAGNFGRDVAAALHAQGKKVAGFIELHPRQANAWGYPVRALADCCPRPQEATVVISSFRSQESLATSLAQSWPNAICRLYPYPKVHPKTPAEAVTAYASA